MHRLSVVVILLTVTTRGEADGTTRFALPEDRFGVNEMWRRVRNVEVGAGSDGDGDEYRRFEVSAAGLPIRVPATNPERNESRKLLSQDDGARLT